MTKTTTTANLGVGFAMQGKRVLLIDADPQVDLTTALGWPDSNSLPVTITPSLTALSGARTHNRPTAFCITPRALAYYRPTWGCPALTVNTIEGNTSDSVARRTHDIGSVKIFGYATPMHYTSSPHLV